MQQRILYVNCDQYYEPSGGGTGTAGITTRRTGPLLEFTSSFVGQITRGTTGPDTLCLFLLSHIHWTATALADGGGDRMPAGVVEGITGGIRKPLGVGKDYGGRPQIAATRDEYRTQGNKG